MSALRFLLLAVLSTLLAARGAASFGAAPRAARPAEAAMVEAAVRRMTSDIATALAHEGPGAWLRYFDDGPGFMMAVDGRLQFDGFESARTFLAGFGKHIVRVDLTLTDERVEALGPGAAALAAAYRESLTDTELKVTESQGYLTGIAVRKAGAWRLRSLHWSSASPAN